MGEMTSGTYENPADELDIELHTFEDLLPSLLLTNYGDWALIRQMEFAGTFAEQRAAVDAGYQRYGNVAFLTRQIIEEQPVINLSRLSLKVLD